jgi:hypothetical protein
MVEHNPTDYNSILLSSQELGGNFWVDLMYLKPGLLSDPRSQKQIVAAQKLPNQPGFIALWAPA